MIRTYIKKEVVCKQTLFDFGDVCYKYTILQCIGCTFFTIIIYFMTGQPLEIERLILFLTVSILLVLASQGFGFVIGSIFNPVVSIIYMYVCLLLKACHRL